MIFQTTFNPFSIFLFFAPCLCQFVVDFNMKPDVTFGDNNDRFDVQDIIQDQNRMDIGNPTDDFRRIMVKETNNKEVENTEGDKDEEIDKRGELIDAIKDTVSNLGINKFAYHSNLDSGPDNNDNEKNLASLVNNRRSLGNMEKLLKKLLKSGRRSVPDDDFVLFNYGVPVNMKIQGFIELPEEET